MEGIAQCYLTEKDVVRHELVQRIVKAYADYESKKGRGKAPDNKHPAFRRKGEKR